MDAVKYVLITLLFVGLLGGCQWPLQPEGNAEQRRYAAAAETQKDRARDAQREYMNCIDHVETRTTRNRLGGGFTSPDVILDSCSSQFERVSIILEQAYDNACRAEKATVAERERCDADSVRLAKRETDRMRQDALELVRRRDDGGGVRLLPGQQPSRYPW